jgi:hypothetical protein
VLKISDKFTIILRIPFLVWHQECCFPTKSLLCKTQFDVCLRSCIFGCAHTGLKVLINDCRWQNVLFYRCFYPQSTLSILCCCGISLTLRNAETVLRFLTVWHHIYSKYSRVATLRRVVHILVCLKVKVASAVFTFQLWSVSAESGQVDEAITASDPTFILTQGRH